MNIQEYISSGIVETYVLGLASTSERTEFEQLCQTHPELVAARDEFERALEQAAMVNAVAPPVHLKQQLMSGLANAGGTVAEKATPKIVQQPLTPVRTLSMSRILAAASIILLLGSTLLNFYFYNRYRSSETKLDELIASTQKLADNNSVMQTRLQQYESSFERLRNPDMAVVAMKGQPVAPQSQTTVYWDTKSKDVYLLVNSLPQPGAGKQYQLWAIVDGKPVDAGVLDMETASAGLVKMKNMPRAQAFAITLEKKGGSQAPTMPIYVMGQT